MAINNCNADPAEVLSSIQNIKNAEATFEGQLRTAASASIESADKFNKFVNGGKNETVQLGSGARTPTVRNVVQQIQNTAAAAIVVTTDLGILNVEDFGASPTASAADNSTAVQAAVNNAAVNGGSVYIPDGIAYLRGNVDPKNVLIIDDSRGIRVATGDFWWRPGPTERRWIAHRGYCSAYPENTVLAFTGAAAAGCYGIETDLQWTSDGYVVCMHDETVDRTTNGSGTVRSKTLSEVLALRADYRSGSAIGDGCFAELKVPQFEEYLDVCKEHGKVPFIEIKTGSSPTNAELEAVVGKVYDYGLESTAFFTSFSLSILQTVRSLSSVCGLMYTVYSMDVSHIAALATLGGKIDYAVKYSALDTQKIKQFRDEGIDVTSWNATDHLGVATAFSYGCTSYCGNAHYEGGMLWR